MTNYFISEGHGDPSNGAEAITPDSFRLHFKRHSVGAGIDYWVLIQADTPRQAQTLYYLLWERNIPMSNGQQKKLFVHNVKFEREIRLSATT
eukprot:8846875-Heterocapsa_arctica.AAC.1